MKPKKARDNNSATITQNEKVKQFDFIDKLVAVLIIIGALLASAFGSDLLHLPMVSAVFLTITIAVFDLFRHFTHRSRWYLFVLLITVNAFVCIKWEIKHHLQSKLPDTTNNAAKFIQPKKTQNSPQIPRIDQVAAIPEKADVQVLFSPRGTTLFHSDGSSEATIVDITLENLGNLRATGLIVTLFFRPRTVSPRVIDGNWQRETRFKGDDFTFEDPQIPMYSKSIRQIGAFEIHIPRKSNEEELLALCEVHGDYGKKMGLIFYNRIKNEYRTWNPVKSIDALNKWNEFINHDNANK